MRIYYKALVKEVRSDIVKGVILIPPDDLLYDTDLNKMLHSFLNLETEYNNVSFAREDETKIEFKVYNSKLMSGELQVWEVSQRKKIHWLDLEFPVDMVGVLIVTNDPRRWYHDETKIEKQRAYNNVINMSDHQYTVTKSIVNVLIKYSKLKICILYISENKETKISDELLALSNDNYVHLINNYQTNAEEKVESLLRRI